MAWRGSVSRSIMSAARAPTSRSSPPLHRLRPPPSASRRFSFTTTPRTLGELGCVQSLLPLHSIGGGVRLTSHLTVNAREFCELSHAQDEDRATYYKSALFTKTCYDSSCFSDFIDGNIASLLVLKAI